MVHTAGAFAGILLGVLAPGTEVESLVARLGSPKYAEREVASSKLEKLGPAAFPALKAARNDRDPEVKSRAEWLLESIERAALTRPTLLEFEPRSYSLGEVVERLGQSQGIALPLADIVDRNAASRRVFRLSDEEPMAFWQVLDRLGLTPQWEFDQDFGRINLRRLAAVRLVARPKKLIEVISR